MSDVRAAADPAVHQQRRVRSGLVPHFDERVQGGDRAVDLPAAVVGDDDPVDAVLERDPSVLGREHALDEDRQVGPLAQPREVAPGEAEVRERGERHQRRRLQVLLRRRIQPLAEEGVAEELRQPFAAEEGEVAVAEIAVAPAERQRVDRDHDRAVPAAPARSTRLPASSRSAHQ